MLKTIAELLTDLVGMEFSDGGVQASQQYQLGQTAPKRETVAEAMYARFLHKFGLPNLADANMVTMAISLSTTRESHKRIGAFTAFAFNELPVKVIDGS